MAAFMAVLEAYKRHEVKRLALAAKYKSISLSQLLSILISIGLAYIMSGG